MKDDLKAIRVRIGRKVKQLRLLRGLSQEKLAELVGNQYKHIGQVERGEVNVGIDILAKIAANLGVDVSELMRPSPGEATGQRLYTIEQPEYEQLERMVERMKRSSRQRAKSD